MRNNKNRAAFKGYFLAAALLCAAPACYADITADKLADLAFGTIDFTAPTGNGNVTLGTNGNVTYGTNTMGNGIGTPGQILLSAPEGTTLSIACSTGTLAIAGGGTLPISPVNFVVGASNIGPYLVGTECNGLENSVATHTITTTPTDNTIFVGGILATNGQPLHNGTYRGTTSGGSQPAFRILVQ